MATGTITGTGMITEAAGDGGLALTRLLQIVSPTLPIGAFAYSQGLEQAVSLGWVSSEPETRDWVLGLLEHSFGTLDLPVLVRLLQAFEAELGSAPLAAVDAPLPSPNPLRAPRGEGRERGQRDSLSRADTAGTWSAWLLASRPTRELREEDRQLGAALARTLAALDVSGADAWMAREDVTHAAMFALAAVRFGIPARAALAGHAFAWAEAVTSAAVRLVPLGQSAGQRVLATVGEAIPPVVARALTLADDDLGAAAPGQAIASAWHETLYSRLFRS